ncbi:MAG: hypothetical protein BWY92_01702 [Firmicutes bacterium ADurb.BinA052]|nr:MAG: hypothetical protein BWY92_01702 [Firmicutes bacterium ADurb.BinA052]
MPARDNLHPSIMLAWFSSSLMIMSSLPRTAATVPALAVNPDWNTSAASVCLNAAIFFSSSTWMSMVPAIVRTAPEPAPNSCAAPAAAAIILGCVARPK